MTTTHGPDTEATRSMRGAWSYWGVTAWAYDTALVLRFSRDPKGEDGGENLYAFVGNNPIKYVDPLGLTALDPNCDCGPDVTKALNKGLENLRSAFNRASPAQKKAACATLATSNGWDIDQLVGTYNSGDKDVNDPNNCHGTVVYQGSCYTASKVNYIAYGVMWDLCSSLAPDLSDWDRFNLGLGMNFTVLGWKAVYKQDGEAWDANSWANTGFNGAPYSPPSPDKPKCRILNPHPEASESAFTGHMGQIGSRISF